MRRRGTSEARSASSSPVVQCSPYCADNRKVAGHHAPDAHDSTTRNLDAVGLHDVILTYAHRCNWSWSRRCSPRRGWRSRDRYRITGRDTTVHRRRRRCVASQHQRQQASRTLAAQAASSQTWFSLS